MITTQTSDSYCNEYVRRYECEKIAYTKVSTVQYNSNYDMAYVLDYNNFKIFRFAKVDLIIIKIIWYTKLNFNNYQNTKVCKIRLQVRLSKYYILVCLNPN